MDISQISPALSALQLHTDVSVAVMDNSLEFLETMGDGMQKIMEASVLPNLGQNIDIQV